MLSEIPEFPYGYRLLYFAHFFWIIAYAAIIARSGRDRLIGIPVLVIPFNLFWELNAFTDCLPLRSGLLLLDAGAYEAVCNALPIATSRVFQVTFYHEAGYLIMGVWLALDVIILVQAASYGDYGTRQLGRLALPARLVVLAILTYLAFLIGARFMVATGDRGGFLTAWLINLVMSALFVILVLRRPHGQGLSVVAAWAKMLGSVLVAAWGMWIMPEVVNQQFPFLRAVFAAVLAGDLAYISLLLRAKARDPAGT